MKQYHVTLLRSARADLTALFISIADRSGSDVVAFRYIERIRRACEKLSVAPVRGRARDDLRPGLRVLGFEKSAIIAFQIIESRVEILRIFYRGRDYETILGGSPEE